MPAPKGFVPVTGKYHSQKNRESFLFEFPPEFDVTVMSDVSLSIPSKARQGIVTKFSSKGKSYIVSEVSIHHLNNLMGVFSDKGEQHFCPGKPVARGFRISEELTVVEAPATPPIVNMVPDFPTKEEMGAPFLPAGYIKEGSATEKVFLSRQAGTDSNTVATKKSQKKRPRDGEEKKKTKKKKTAKKAKKST